MRLAARATKFESFRFYGFGNDTDRERTSLARVDEDVIAVEPAVIWQIGWRSREGLGSGLGDGDDGFPGLRPMTGSLEAGPFLYWTKVRPAPGSPFMTEAGVQDLEASGRVGVRLGLDLDRHPAGRHPIAAGDSKRIWLGFRRCGMSISRSAPPPAWGRCISRFPEIERAGVGAGFWLSALGQTVSVAFVRGEVNRGYLKRGLSF